MLNQKTLNMGGKIESSNTTYTKTEQDKRLLQKYPTIYKQIYNILKTSHKSQQVTIRKICEIINRPAVIEEILDNVSWSLSIENSYIFSEHNSDIVPSPLNLEKLHNHDIIFRVDFHADFDLVNTKPEQFGYFGKDKECCDSWSVLYVYVLAAIIKDYPHMFQPGMSFSQQSGEIDLTNNDNYNFMVAPKPIPGTVYILETNLDANEIATKIRYVLDLCNITYKNIIITYRKKIKEPSEQAHKKKSLENNTTYEITNRSFFRYLSETQKMADSTCRSYVSAINNCEVFAQEHQLSSWQLYTTDKQSVQETIKLLLSNVDFLAYNTRQHNRLRTALMKFIEFTNLDLTWITAAQDDLTLANNYRDESYEEVLKKHFKKGFRMDSPLELRKFKRYYIASHQTELTDSDEDISKKIKQHCIIYEGKAFLPDIMLSEELKKELLNYIEDTFSNGKVVIYYQVIFTNFFNDFLDYHIHDVNMLKLYLAEIGKGRFFINRNFISKIPAISIDPIFEVRSYLQDYGKPATYDEVFTALPHLSPNKIKSILANNEEFIKNGRSEYFHKSIVRLSDKELDGIAEIIQSNIDTNYFISGNELYDAICAKYPSIIEENQSLSIYGFRDILKTKLDNQFSFKGNIISRLDEELSMTEVFAQYAKDHDTFTLSELQELADNLATPIYFDVIYENSLRISQDKFVAKTAAQFPIEAIDEALDRICIGKYIPIKEVTNFGAFPYVVGFPWNSFLLEHYVADYSHNYMLLHNNFNRTNCSGAIVKRSIGINSFDELIIDLLVNSQVEMKKQPVLQFLSDKGYLIRRRYSKIELLIIKANAQRQGKDTD